MYGKKKFLFNLFHGMHGPLYNWYYKLILCEFLREEDKTSHMSPASIRTAKQNRNIRLTSASQLLLNRITELLPFHLSGH